MADRASIAGATSRRYPRSTWWRVQRSCDGQHLRCCPDRYKCRRIVTLVGGRRIRSVTSRLNRTSFLHHGQTSHPRRCYRLGRCAHPSDAPFSSRQSAELLGDRLPATAAPAAKHERTDPRVDAGDGASVGAIVVAAPTPGRDRSTGTGCSGAPRCRPASVAPQWWHGGPRSHRRDHATPIPRRPEWRAASPPVAA